MSEKHINYMTRTFDDFKAQLIAFTKQYYPELTDAFNDAGVGQWLMDLYAAVGDDLSYHIDRVYQNTSIDSSSSMNAIMNLARSMGLKVPGRKAGMCEVQFTCTLPVLVKNGVAGPNWNYAPIIKKGTKVSAGSYIFELRDDVNFAEQFNSNNYSDRKYSPVTGANGNLINYTVSKTGIVLNVSSHVYRKVLTANDVYPFMEVILPDKDICGIESVIFKASSSYNGVPETDEFMHPEEVYRISRDTCNTMRFFEVDSLSNEYVFNGVTGTNGEIYEDYTEDGVVVSRVYKGGWRGIRQKFITEYTDNGYLKLTFGAGTEYADTDTFALKASDVVNGMINNDMLGVLPKEGWTMFVLYDTCDGMAANLGIGAINTINSINLTMPSTATNQQNKSSVANSITVTNLSNVLGGKNFPTVEEIKYLIKYNSGALGRGVVIQDYKHLISRMPARYGAPYKVAVKEENNKIKISLLNALSNGNLTPDIPSLLVDNMVNYLEMYKMLGDYIAVTSGKIYNIGVNCNVFIGKTYNGATVVNNVKNAIEEFFKVSNYEMGDDLYIGLLERAIMDVDGVMSIIDLDIYNLYDGPYSTDVCPLPRAVVSETCGKTKSITFTSTETGMKSFMIDLPSVDNVLFSDDNSMYEVKYPNKDIIVKFKQL